MRSKLQDRATGRRSAHKWWRWATVSWLHQNANCVSIFSCWAFGKYDNMVRKKQWDPRGSTDINLQGLGPETQNGQSKYSNWEDNGLLGSWSGWQECDLHYTGSLSSSLPEQETKWLAGKAAKIISAPGHSVHPPFAFASVKSWNNGLYHSCRQSGFVIGIYRKTYGKICINKITLQWVWNSSSPCIYWMSKGQTGNGVLKLPEKSCVSAKSDYHWAIFPSHRLQALKITLEATHFHEFESVCGLAFIFKPMTTTFRKILFNCTLSISDTAWCIYTVHSFLGE